MLSSKQPVDGEWPYSTDTQTDEHSAQCLVCFLRAAGGNVSRGPCLGEAGCPGFLRGSLALGSVFSVVHFLSQGHQRHTLPLDFLAFSPAYIQELAELLMCCQSRQTRLSEARSSSEYLNQTHKNYRLVHFQPSLPSTPQHLFIMNQHNRSCNLTTA